MSLSFYTLKDLSNLAKGEKLLVILSLHGLIIEKAGEYEPIRKEFDLDSFPHIWKGKGTKSLDCTFIFKGKKEISFSGMVSWNLNIHPSSKYFNVIGLWLNIPKKYDLGKLIRLGDDMFIWAEAVYGYITEESINLSHTQIQKDGFTVSLGNLYRGISGLMWVNYFGTPYLQENDFHLPADHTPVGHGAKIVLTDAPDDERLSDLNFRKTITDKIGADWFFQFEKIENGVGFLAKNCQQFKKTEKRDKGYQYSVDKIPCFDNSEITIKS